MYQIYQQINRGDYEYIIIITLVHNMKNKKDAKFIYPLYLILQINIRFILFDI